MGKLDFKNLYQRIKRDLGDVTCKTSFYCDKFDPTRNYAGVIVYAIDGNYRWTNSGQLNMNELGEQCSLI